MPDPIRPPAAAPGPSGPPGPPASTPRRGGGRSPAWVRDLAGAWVFYSVLPAWPWIEPRFERIARFGPWVGAVLGGVQALVWLLSSGWLPPMAQVALVIALGLGLTGGLHSDGAIDTADGLAAGPRVLEAMDDSRVGAAGVQAFAVLLLLRAAGLLALANTGLAGAAGWALLSTAIWGRLAPLLAMAHYPYLREQGTAGFHRERRRSLPLELLPGLLLLGGLLLGGLVLAGTTPLVVAAVLLLPALPALAVPVWFGRRLGGHSGDTYGACVEWTESLGLLISGLVLSGAG